VTIAVISNGPACSWTSVLMPCDRIDRTPDTDVRRQVITGLMELGLEQQPVDLRDRDAAPVALVTRDLQLAGMVPATQRVNADAQRLGRLLPSTGPSRGP
jgi:hypothetical protein